MNATVSLTTPAVAVDIEVALEKTFLPEPHIS